MKLSPSLLTTFPLLQFVQNKLLWKATLSCYFIRWRYPPALTFVGSRNLPEGGEFSGCSSLLGDK